ncbi:MAG: LytTR family DNA-binding domain-containing protein [bacterium]
MKILIIEDEPPIAEDVKDLTKSILGGKVEKIDVRHSLAEAFDYLDKHQIDLCLLDLNLKGKNGYEILQRSIAGSFHTIIISAYIDQAIEAFNYGVLDFVPKPVEEVRLKAAFDRYLGKLKNRDIFTKYLVIRKKNSNHIISIDQIIYFKALGYIVEVHLENGKVEVTDKPLNSLEQILPLNYIRVHRSFILDINHLDHYSHKGSGVYEIYLNNGETIPLSFGSYKNLKSKLEPFKK